MTTYAPTTIPGGDPTDVLGRRVGAYFIDLVLVLIVVAAFLIPSFNDKSYEVSANQFRCAIGDSATSRDGSGRIPITEGLCIDWGDNRLKVVDEDEFVDLIVEFWVVYGLVQVLNLIILQGLTGASIGKHLVGLRVVRGDTGRHAHVGWAALRTLLLQIDAACCGILGIVMAATTKGHRRLGDMAAGTFVIRKEHVGQPVQVPGLNAGYSVQGGPGYTPPSYGAPSGWNVGPSDPSTGWGSTGPAAPGTWGAPDTGPGAPGAPTTPTAPPPSSAEATPGADAPSWDSARNAYIQYDRELAAWMQWDDASQQWKPISQ